MKHNLVYDYQIMIIKYGYELPPYSTLPPPPPPIKKKLVIKNEKNYHWVTKL